MIKKILFIVCFIIIWIISIYVTQYIMVENLKKVIVEKIEKEFAIHHKEKNDLNDFDVFPDVPENDSIILPYLPELEIMQPYEPNQLSDIKDDIDVNCVNIPIRCQSMENL